MNLNRERDLLCVFFPRMYYVQGNRLVMWFVFDIFNKELIVVVMDFHHSVSNWLKTEKEKKNITTMALIYISALLFDKWATNRNMSHVIKVQSSTWYEEEKYESQQFLIWRECEAIFMLVIWVWDMQKCDIFLERSH